jgi:hypothetical protein
VHVPRAIARFGHHRAADVLLGRLRVEPGGRLRYRILRALGRLMTEVTGLHLDREVLDGIVEDHLANAFRNLHWPAVLRAGAEAVPMRRTVGHHLLLERLEQREACAVERLFRGLGLGSPEADFAQLYDSLHSEEAATRGAARELLEQLLPPRWRDAVLALTDDGSDEDRLASGQPFYVAEPIEYDQLLLEMASHPSDAVAALASYHAVELGILDAAHLQRFDASTNWIRGWRRPPPEPGAATAAPLAAEAATIDDELVWAAGGRS